MTTFHTDDGTERRIPEDDGPLYVSALKRNLEGVLDLSRNRFSICIENYGIGHSEMDLLEPYLGKDGLYLCWDVAKGRAQPEIEMRFLAIPQLVKQVHVHDVREVMPGQRGSHRTVGSGSLDFRNIVETIQRLPVLEDCCIEVRPREKALESMLTLKVIAEASQYSEPADGGR
jgi:sugar phosphate isomerase/epimerase